MIMQQKDVEILIYILKPFFILYLIDLFTP